MLRYRNKLLVPLRPKIKNAPSPKGERAFLLHRTFGNTNYFTFPVNAYSHGRNLILDDEYFAILRSKKKHEMETAEERKLRFLRLVNKHNFTRANLARHLGCSRAWVTKVLG